MNTSAWEWNEDRKEFYLHQFGKEQPDLNFHNPQVVAEFDKVLRMWMKTGADGVRYDFFFLFLSITWVHCSDPTSSL